MAFANKSLTLIRAAYKQSGILTSMLQEYDQGNPAPATKLGRFTVAEIEAQITATKAAVDAINAA